MDIPSALFQLISAAAIVESLTETVFIPIEAKIKDISDLWKKLTAIAFGILVCTLIPLDLFALIGIPFIVPVVGSVLTGILVSRGADFIHQLIKKVSPTKE